jgi:hypothetical protein
MSEKMIVEDLVNKYRPLLEKEGYPILNEKYKKFTAISLENYRRNMLEEETITGDISKYDPVLLPIIRRGLASLIGPEIFGMQPMTAPTGLLFCMRSIFQNDSVNPVKRSNSKVLILADGSGFDASTDISTDGTGAGIGVVRYREDNTILVEVTSGSFAVGDNVDDANPFVTGVTTVSKVYDNEAQYRFQFADYAKFASVAAAEQAGTTQKEMGFVVDRTSVTAESFKMKAKYTDELAQDLKSVHGLDAESELTRILGDEVSMEQNRKFINYLIERAKVGGSTTWNHASISYGGDADGRWALEKTFSFYQYINTIANNIAKTILRGRGNFLVVSLDVASVLEASKFWTSSLKSTEDIMDVNLGMSAFIGTLGRKYKVYVDLYAEEDYIVVGYKGASEWDAGIYYAPYVPIYVKKTIDPENGQPRLFFHTRYGLADNPFGSENYYRYIKVTL